MMSATIPRGSRARRFRSCRARAGLLLAGALLAMTPACRQAAPPGPPPASQSGGVSSTPQTIPASESPPSPPASQTRPGQQTPHFEVSEPGPIITDRPSTLSRPLAILSKLDPVRPGTLRATLMSDSLLAIDTENVQTLRLDLLNLPRQQPGRLIVRIDGQGIEITGKNQIIYLQRSTTGEWSFGRPATRPVTVPR
jgi:hypothetical protein